MKSNHSNIVVYLKGIMIAELEHILDFIYNGEASVAEADIHRFISTGKELKIKGLEEDFALNNSETRIESPIEMRQIYQSNENESIHENMDDNFQNRLRTDEDVELRIEIDTEVNWNKDNSKTSCPICNKKYDSQWNVRRHMEGKHGLDMSLKSTRKLFKIQPTKRQCPHCKSWFGGIHKHIKVCKNKEITGESVKSQTW